MRPVASLCPRQTCYDRSEITMSTLPTRRAELVFRLKARALQARRALLDWREGIRRLERGQVDAFPFVVATSRTPLRGADLTCAERALEAGKIQNLRVAARRLDGVLLAPDRVFSFWKHVGQATPRRGFARGRLLREGCLVPAVGGGLCQMSNALYEVALQAELEIIERWAHSRTVPGSAAVLGRDATVAWNYIDLRFSSTRPLLLQVLVTRDELMVQLRSPQPPLPVAAPAPANFIPLSSLAQAKPWLEVAAHSCASCAQDSCFRHEKHEPQVTASDSTRTLCLLDEAWPEFIDWVQQNANADDVLATPRPLEALRNLPWARAHTARLFALDRSIQVRRARDAARRNTAQFKCNQDLSRALCRALSPDIERVVVAQSLLPFVWRSGVLGGREFDVLMTRPPLEMLHQRLDEALRSHPERSQLGDFRAPLDLIRDEERALEAARACITPHAHLASLLEARRLEVRKLEWQRPASTCSRARSARRAIAFPGPTSARKGAHDVRAVARELDLEVVLGGSELEGAGFWSGVRTRRVARGDDSWLRGVSAVVQPAIYEEQPRALLRALAQGVPVVATRECGLGEVAGLGVVEFGDAKALSAAVASVLS